MSNAFQKRLYELEIAPPAQVWEKLAAGLDEINTDNLLATKILKSESYPPQGVWDIINDSILTEVKNTPKRKSNVISLKSFAVAAIFLGIVVSLRFLFFNPGQQNKNLVTVETQVKPGEINSQLKTTPSTLPSINETKIPATEKDILAGNGKKRNNKSPGTLQSFYVKNKQTGQQSSITTPDLAINMIKISGENSDQSVIDFANISSDEHFTTIANANGRIVKIPANLVFLIPHLQNKPLDLDEYDNLFGEGAIWKDKLAAWRQLLATTSVTSGDLFSPMIELMKSLQPKPVEESEKGR